MLFYHSSILQKPLSSRSAFYVYDTLSLYSPGFGDNVKHIYSIEFEIKNITHLRVLHNPTFIKKLKMTVGWKHALHQREYFSFLIVQYAFILITTPAPSYRVHISQSI